MTPTLSPLVGSIFEIVGKNGPEQKEILIGRSPFCDIVLEHRAVSELHCQIDKSAGVYTIADQGSTNGSQVNGEPLDESASHTLRDEDVLTIGQYSFQFFTPRILFKYLELRESREKRALFLARRPPRGKGQERDDGRHDD